MEDVKNMLISDGVTYTGPVKSDGLNLIPHGVGVMKYSDHSELGVFQDGQLNGIGYINYHDWMYVGLVSYGKINGWGLKVDRGTISFGVFKDSVLKVNLTPLVEIFWDKILEDANALGKSAVSVLKKGEIFVGVPQTFFTNRLGFHFLGNGEVFLGVCEDGQKGRTGSFLHFDLDYNITKGDFKDGEFVNEIDDDDFTSKCGVWVNHAYLDFDINMNYYPESFMLDLNEILHIFEMGKTDENIIVKANKCRVVDRNRIEAQNGDCEDTMWFAFPIDDTIEKELVELMNCGDHPWMPKYHDYRLDFINNLSNSDTNHRPLYRHISCWDKDADYDLDVFYDFDPSDFETDESENEEEEELTIMARLIPDFYYKHELLTQQWKSGDWYYAYPSLRDYVISLATEDDVENFFGWLFNDSRLNDCSIYSLPYEYRQAYEQFLNLFFDLD